MAGGHSSAVVSVLEVVVDDAVESADDVTDSDELVDSDVRGPVVLALSEDKVAEVSAEDVLLALAVAGSSGEKQAEARVAARMRDGCRGLIGEFVSSASKGTGAE